MARDGHFSAGVIRALRDRVGGRCSNPGCRRATVGPAATATGKAAIVGEAAHITAASVGGPRYDAGQDEASRHSIENAIWLCATCATLIDKNGGQDYLPSRLMRWKQQAEAQALRSLETGGAPETEWSSNIAQIRYVNIPTLLHLAVSRGDVLDLDASLPGGWLHNQSIGLARTLLACNRYLDQIHLRSVSIERLAGSKEDLSGLTVSFDRRFYTKNGPDCPTDAEPPPISADWNKAPHIYAKIGQRKVVMVLDPRWFTTTTAFVDFRSGQARFAGLAILKRGHPGDAPILASPIVIGIPTSPLMDALDRNIVGQ